MNLDTELELEIFIKAWGEVIFREDPLGRDHTSWVCRELSVRGLKQQAYIVSVPRTVCKRS